MNAAKPYNVTVYQVAHAIHEHWTCPIRQHTHLSHHEVCDRFQRLVVEAGAIMERATTAPLVSYTFPETYDGLDTTQRDALAPAEGQISLYDLL